MTTQTYSAKSPYCEHTLDPSTAVDGWVTCPCGRKSDVRWVSELPAQFDGVLVGNELLDAMPVQLLVRLGGVWHERGVVWNNAEQCYEWQDRVTDLRPPWEIHGPHDYLTEIHPQAHV